MTYHYSLYVKRFVEQENLRLELIQFHDLKLFLFTAFESKIY